MVGGATSSAAEDKLHHEPMFPGGAIRYGFRAYADVQDIEGGLNRHALTANLRVQADSGLTSNAAGLGLNASMFVGADLASSSNAGNMAHVNSDWSRAGRTWVYIGEYGMRYQSKDYSLHYGLQQLSNPFLETKDNRGLPPTIRGLSGTSALNTNLKLEAGSIDSVIPRGMETRQPLSTTYGNTSFHRLEFVGLVYEGAEGVNASAYAARAHDVWMQYFSSVTKDFGKTNTVHIKGSASTYVTRSIGGTLQGHIDNTAYSCSISPIWGPVSITAGYQKISGGEFFDYLAETSGIVLDNAFGADYNAPNERSLMLNLSLNGSVFGWHGFKSTIWRVRGWGADASATAAKYADPAATLHALYWKNGQPVQGTHHEEGIYVEYVPPSGTASTLTWKLFAVRHLSTPHYSEDPFSEIRLTVSRQF